MKKKGLSLEDKRRKMSEIFKDDPSFYHLKDIEKLGTKKGITYQSIKDVLDSLVNDYLVETDKIGSSSFFWALPSKIYHIKKTQMEKNIQALSTDDATIESLTEKIQESKAVRKETDERAANLEELDQMIVNKEELIAKIDSYQKNDPERYQNILSDTKLFVTLTEMMKDNIMGIQQWMKTKNPDAKLVDMFPYLEGYNIFD
jgi:vacuolar-type H+-ATPase subunit I/STV1